MKTGEKATSGYIYSLQRLHLKHQWGEKKIPKSSESQSVYVDCSDRCSKHAPNASWTRRELKFNFQTYLLCLPALDRTTYFFSIQYVSEMYLLKPEVQKATLKSGKSNHICISQLHNQPRQVHYAVLDLDSVISTNAVSARIYMQEYSCDRKGLFFFAVS